MKKMPKSIRKHIRKEKARIRRDVLSWKDQEKQIQDLYNKFTPLTKPAEARPPQAQKFLKKAGKVKVKSRPGLDQAEKKEEK